MSEPEKNVRAILAKQADLPPYLRRDEETVRADERAQSLLRASFTRSRMTDAERLITRGKQHEEIALSNLPLVRNEEELKFESARLSHGLELQGRYLEAADAHPIEEEKQRLKAIHAATEKDDSEFCGCEPHRAEVNGQTVEVHPHYELKQIYSRRHGRTVSLVACSKCPELNVTPRPPAQLAKILAAHAGSHAQAKVGLRQTAMDVHLLRSDA